MRIIVLMRLNLADKVCILKAVIFPVVIYGCESWTIKKAESWRTDVFELKCWRRLLTVPWTARRSKQSTLKECESKSEVAQSCLTLCDPLDCSLPGSSLHGIFQARVLEWVGISFFRGSSQPRDWTQVSRIAGRRFTIWATREAKTLI